MIMVGGTGRVDAATERLEAGQGDDRQLLEP
jgi:hypothetical protein